MRGKPARYRAFTSLVRNIPAYAGKTSTPGCSIVKCAEHPRVCGENLPIGEKSHFDRGTSPRMRGKLDPAEVILIPGRNIPAYAGKTG